MLTRSLNEHAGGVSAGRGDCALVDDVTSVRVWIRVACAMEGCHVCQAQTGRTFACGRDAGVESQVAVYFDACLLYTSPSPRDGLLSRMPSSA